MAEFGQLQSVRADGSFAIDDAAVETRRRTAVDRQWTWLRQVHGNEVVVVTEPGEHAGAAADAAVSRGDGVVLCVQTADCVPVTFTSPSTGAIGVAHAGWRGVQAGVIDATVDALVRLGASRDDLTATIGPHISAPHYEFGQRELTELALQFGPDVIAATHAESPALDVGAAVGVALRGAGVVNIDASGAECTAATVDTTGAPKYFSHRARADVGRMTTAVWKLP